MDTAELGDLLVAAADDQVATALLRLSRVVGDRPEVADVARDLLDRHLSGLIRRSGGSDVDVTNRLTELVMLVRPELGAALSVISLPPVEPRNARMIGEIVRTVIVPLKAVAAAEGGALPELARAYVVLSIVFGTTGDGDRSVKAGLRAVDVYRKLVRRDGNGRVPDLASALDNLAVAYLSADDNDAAVRCTEEAVALLRGTDDHAQGRSFAHTMTNHALAITKAGRRAEGLECSGAAVQAWRALVADGDTAARADLEWALHNLSVHLAGLRRDRESLAAIKESVQICRELTATDSSAGARLARSMNCLSDRLGAVGRAAEGFAAIEEAVRIRRELAAASEEHLADLAQSLTNLSARSRELGRPADEAFRASEEAVTIRRRLARVHPRRHHPSLAIALINLSMDLSSAGLTDRAVVAAEEAVVIRRSLAADDADGYGPALARALRTVSVALATAGRLTESSAAADEAVELLRATTASRPELRADLSQALHTQAVRRDTTGRWPEALDAVQEAIGLLRELAADDPDARLSDLATSLSSLSVCLTHAGRPADAVAADEEAVAIWRGLAASDPRRHGRNLALGLNNLGASLGDLGRDAAGLAALTEAVEIRRTLFEAGHHAVFFDLMVSVANTALCLDRLERPVEAEALFDSTVGEYENDERTAGVAHLARAAWRAGRGDWREAIASAQVARGVLQDDPVRLAEVRSLLVQLRRDHVQDFDDAWQAGDVLPLWLRHLHIPPLVR